MTIKRISEDPRSEAEKEADSKVLEAEMDRKKKAEELAGALGMSTGEVLRLQGELRQVDPGEEVGESLGELPEVNLNIVDDEDGKPVWEYNCTKCGEMVRKEIDLTKPGDGVDPMAMCDECSPFMST